MKVKIAKKTFAIFFNKNKLILWNQKWNSIFFQKVKLKKSLRIFDFLSFRILILLSNPSITIIMMIGIPQSIVTAKVLYTIMETTTKWTIGSVTYAKMTLFSGKKRKSESKNWIKWGWSTVKNCCTFQHIL